jgi:hypothetical protein
MLVHSTAHLFMDKDVSPQWLWNLEHLECPFCSLLCPFCSLHCSMLGTEHLLRSSKTVLEQVLS